MRNPAPGRGRHVAETAAPLAVARRVLRRSGPARHVAPAIVQQRAEPTTEPIAVLLADALRSPAGAS